jgi:hypothetical protein
MEEGDQRFKMSPPPLPQGIRDVDTLHDEDDVDDAGRYLDWDALAKKRAASGYYEKKARDNRQRSPPSYPSFNSSHQASQGSYNKKYMEPDEWMMVANHDKFKLLHLMFLVVFFHMVIQGFWVILFMLFSSSSDYCRTGVSCIMYTLPTLVIPLPLFVVWFGWKINAIRASRSLAMLVDPWVKRAERLSISDDSHIIEMDDIRGKNEGGEDLEITTGATNPGIVWTQKDVTVDSNGNIISYISTWASNDLRRRWGCKPLILFVMLSLFIWINFISLVSGWDIVAAMANIVTGTGGCIFELYIFGRYLRETGYIGSFPCNGDILFACVGTYFSDLGPCCNCFDGADEEEYYYDSDDNDEEVAIPSRTPKQQHQLSSSPVIETISESFSLPPQQPPPRPPVPSPPLSSNSSLKHDM